MGLLGVAIVLLAIAFFLGRATSPEAPEDSPSTRVPDSQEERTGITDQPDEAGAVAAATYYSRVMSGPTGDPALYLESMESIAAPQWTTRASELAQNAVDFVTERYGQGGSVEFKPIRYRVRSYSGDEAVIDIWGVVIGSGPNIRGIEESWITGAVTLVWIESEWKVAGQSSKGGPTPEVVRTEDALTVEEILSEFNEYRDASDS